MRNLLYTILVLIVVALIAYFSLSSSSDNSKTSNVSGNSEAQVAEIIGWRDIVLEDAVSGDTFSIADFKGKAVFLESFAVWCPTCLKQQKEVKKMREIENSDEIVHISIDTDPNEEINIIRDHAQENGFDWYYTVSPKEMTAILINEFSIEIVNAPSVPMILICPDQSAQLLKRGVKSPEFLLEEIERICVVS